MTLHVTDFTQLTFRENNLDWGYIATKLQHGICSVLQRRPRLVKISFVNLAIFWPVRMILQSPGSYPAYMCEFDISLTMELLAPWFNPSKQTYKAFTNTTIKLVETSSDRFWTVCRLSNFCVGLPREGSKVTLQ